MSVNLVCISQPVGIAGISTAEELIAYCARVSNPSNQLNTNTANGLLDYMKRHQHWSPFEMVSATLEITTTRDIGRQILRHGSFSFQEFSQRYAQTTEYTAPREARLQDSKNRQNSLDSADHDLNQWWQWEQSKVLERAQSAYAEAIANGIAKEVARAVLPEGMTGTRMYMAGTLRSWMHYVDLRTQPDTQKEHRDIALQCQSVLAGHFPSVFNRGV